MGNRENSGAEQPQKQQPGGMCDGSNLLCHPFVTPEQPGAPNGEAREPQSRAAERPSDQAQCFSHIGAWTEETPRGGSGSTPTGQPPARPNQSQSTPRRLGAQPSRDLVERFLSHQSANVIDRLHQDAPRYSTSGSGANGQPAGASK
jgi:hypothetical protein